MKRYKSDDLFTLLEGLVDQYVMSYKTDFDYDKEKFERAVHEKDKDFIWILRECGTQCEKEHLAFVEGTRDNIECNYFLPWEAIKTFYVHVDGLKNGKVTGSVYPVNALGLLEEIKKNQSAAKEILLFPKESDSFSVSCEEYRRSASSYWNNYDIVKMEYVLSDSDKQKVSAILREHEESRNRAKVGQVSELFPEKISLSDRISKASEVTGVSNKENKKEKNQELQI